VVAQAGREPARTIGELGEGQAAAAAGVDQRRARAVPGRRSEHQLVDQRRLGLEGGSAAPDHAPTVCERRAPR
jgi:hypothetical protein